MAFDVEGARKAGYSDSEIADHLAKASGFDIAGARKAGYSDTELVQHLSTKTSKPAKPAEQQTAKPTNAYGAIYEPVKNAILGALRGAGSIGATILTPVDMALGNTTSIGNPERRQAMDDAITTLGGDTNALSFKGGKFGAEVAGTAGIPFARFVPGSGIAGYGTTVAKNALAGASTAALIAPESTATGAGIGGGISAVGIPLGVAGRAAYRGVIDPAMNLLRTSGPENIARNFIRDKVGESNIPATISSARNAVADVAGYPLTTAEAMVTQRPNIRTGKAELSMIPEGTAVSRIQQVESMQPGGASALMNKRLDVQNQAVDSALKARDVAAKPVLDQAYRAVDVAGGVPAAPISQRLDTLTRDSEFKGLPVVQKAISDIRNNIERSKDAKTGMFDAETLHNIRKDLGLKIKSVYDRANVKVDGAKAAKLETEIQKVIDEEMNAAIRSSGMRDVAPGVTIWDRFLDNFSQASKDAETAIARRELANNPLQRTAIGESVDIAKSVTPQMANMLSRPVMASNFVLRVLGKRIEPKVDEAVMKIMTDPNEYARVMSSLTPAGQSQVSKVLAAARNPLVVAGVND